MSSSTIRVTLPESFSLDDRAYFYQSLSSINYYLLPGTNVVLDACTKDKEAPLNVSYDLIISFNETVVKTSVTSESYHSAIKEMMASLQEKFSEILKNVIKKESKNNSTNDDGDDEKKVIH